MIKYNKFKLSIILFCYIVGAFVGMLLLYVFRLYTDIFNHEVWMDIATTYMSYMFFIAYIILQFKKQNINLKMLGKSDKSIILLKEKIMAFTIHIILSIMVAIAVLCIMEIGGYSVEDTLFSPPSYDSAIVPIIMGIRAVVLTPIIEEILLRGIIYEKLKIKYDVRKALVLSSILFGVLHIGCVPQMISGLIWGAWYIKTKSLRTSILVHMLINFVASIELPRFLINPFGFDDIIGEIIQGQQSALCIVVVLMIAIIIISYLVVRYIFVNYKDYFQYQEPS